MTTTNYVMQKKKILTQVNFKNKTVTLFVSEQEVSHFFPLFF